MNKIEFKGNQYPAFQASGFAARFAFPFAFEVCKGFGIDVGCNRMDWALPHSIPVDPVMNPKYDAYNLPDEWHFVKETTKFGLVQVDVTDFDYIFSSHCLEHLPDWVKALDYWHTRIKSGGVVFLYLPDHSQVYWRSWHNRKHIHNLTPEIVGNYFKDQSEMWKDVLVSNVDLNNSFIVIAYKK
jgi:SAM-dependent methyltransferase